MFPGKDTYVPQFTKDQPPPLTIEDVRARGVIVATSDDGTRATVELRDGAGVSLVGVLLNPDGSIRDFVPRPVGVNRFAGTFTRLDNLPPTE